MTILFECTRCGCTNMTEEDVTYETFSQTQEEPGEYEIRCSECLSSTIEEVSVFWCKDCDDVQVKDDNDYCGECHQYILEDKADARRDDIMNIYESKAGWILVDTKRLLQLDVGNAAKTSRNKHVVIESLHPPHKVSSQGKVTVTFSEPGDRKIRQMTYYASVIGCEYQYIGDLS